MSTNEGSGFANRLESVLSTSSPQPAAWLSVIFAAAAIVAGVTGSRARYITVISTLFHEAGHALLAVLTGGGVHVIRLHDHESGVTFVWHWSRVSSVLTSFAGYAVPPLAGLGAARMTHDGKAAPALAVLVVAAVLVLLVSRGFATIATVALVGISSAVLLWWGSPTAQAVVVSALAWLLLTCEAIHLLKCGFSRYWHGLDLPSDGDALARETHLPVPVWLALWLGLSGACVWLAAPLLVSV